MRKVSLLESSSSTDPVVVGRLGRPHGLDGSLVLHMETDHPDRFVVGSAFNTDTGRRLTVRYFRHTGEQGLVAFEEAMDRTAAEALAGAMLTIEPAARRPLADEEFWPDELEGLEVRDPGGRVLGKVIAVEQGAAQDRLVVKGDGEPFDVPMVKELVPQVDVAAGYLTVIPIPGLITPPSAQ
jgi:16S rRNA processing protein RimM